MGASLSNIRGSLKKCKPEPWRTPRTSLKKWLLRLRERIPAKIQVLRQRPAYCGSRFHYQRDYADFDLRPGAQVLDIGSGGQPFPYATVLVDRFAEPSQHRHGVLVRAAKPLVLADVDSLPFSDKCFDFVHCSHVLEHVADPVAACAEIARVGKRGYIETPTFCKDSLFGWAAGMHKWYVVAIGRSICFFEYSPRQLEGIRSSVFKDIIFGNWYHPLQEAFYENQDIFNTMFNWVGRFTVFVLRLDGTVEALNAEIERKDAVPHSQDGLS